MQRQGRFTASAIVAQPANGDHLPCFFNAGNGLSFLSNDSAYATLPFIACTSISAWAIAALPRALVESSKNFRLRDCASSSAFPLSTCATISEKRCQITMCLGEIMNRTVHCGDFSAPSPAQASSFMRFCNSSLRAFI